MVKKCKVMQKFKKRIRLLLTPNAQRRKELMVYYKVLSRNLADQKQIAIAPDASRLYVGLGGERLVSLIMGLGNGAAGWAPPQAMGPTASSAADQALEVDEEGWVLQPSTNQ